MCSIVYVPIYIPTNSARGFPFSTSSSAFMFCRFVDGGHSDKIVLVVLLNCISLINSNVAHLFMYLLAICISSLGKCLF